MENINEDDIKLITWLKAEHARRKQGIAEGVYTPDITYMYILQFFQSLEHHCGSHLIPDCITVCDDGTLLLALKPYRGNEPLEEKRGE